MNESPQEFDQLLAALRPRLHRYCARMVGSSIDGEDIVQDALLRACAARPAAGVLDNPRAWLFRIAHNAALDFLRRQSRTPQAGFEDELDTLAAPESPDPDASALPLRSFLQLPALQRGAVILKDVLDHTLEEAAAITGASEPAVKSALQRGRGRLRTLADSFAAPALPALDAATQARLAAYVEGFKAGDFDAVRALLAEDVQLDLVARLKRSGKEGVGEYLGRYAACTHWAYAAGEFEGRAAMLVFDRGVSLAVAAHVVLLDFVGGRVTAIRDFLFTPYVMDGA